MPERINREKSHGPKRVCIFNALVVTSRQEEELGRISKTVIKPLRIVGKRLSSFVDSYLVRQGKRDLFLDSEFFFACSRLSDMVGEREITVLLAKLFADQMISAKDGSTDERLPNNIPDLMLRNLNDLNRSIVENKIDDRLIHQSAQALAWQCLEKTYRPTSVLIDQAFSALNFVDCPIHIDYLEHRLHLIRTDPVTRDRIKFLLDPVAEYLAGLHLVAQNGENAAAWKEFIITADNKVSAPETIKSFLLALRDCILAHFQQNKIPDFAVLELSRLAGITPKS